MTGLNLSCKFSFTTGTVNQLNQYSISDSSKRFLRFNKILRPRNQVLTPDLQFWVGPVSDLQFWVGLVSLLSDDAWTWHCVEFVEISPLKSQDWEMTRLDPVWPCHPNNDVSPSLLKLKYKQVSKLLFYIFLKFLLKNQLYVLKIWISSIFWSKNQLKILHWQFYHPLIHRTPFYSMSHDRLRSSLCSLPVWSFWKHSSQTRTDLFLRYSKGARLSEQLEHTTWQTKIKWISNKFLMSLLIW